MAAIPGVDAIRALLSFRRMELAVQPGMRVARSIDCFTRPGSVLLTHVDRAVLEKDVAVIRALEEHGALPAELRPAARTLCPPCSPPLRSPTGLFEFE